MLLDPKDVRVFFTLHRALMFFVNQKLEVIPDRPANPNEYSSLSPDTRVKVHDAFIKHTELIQLFVDENPPGFSRDQLDIILSWRHLVHGRFFVFRELKNYTVFLSTERPPIAYGVLALLEPFEDLIGPYLPVMVETILLPFKNQIIYDGAMSRFNITFGGGIRHGLNEDFKEAKARHGIVASLPLADKPTGGIDAPVVEHRGQKKLGKVSMQEELTEIKRETRKLKTRLSGLQRRRSEVEKALGDG
ncbi:MAG TPA: hypothetical protein VHY37_06870 [Tepidisphaeraceae bacterium]|jgi:hypothetical protein|nr:hypothetical protein [Tepidisphaeraceae bacterium]